MDHDKKKSAAARGPAKPGAPSGVIIALAVAGGVVLGSTVTYFYFQPKLAAKDSPAPATAAPAAASVIATPAAPAPGQFTPAPQPPGEAPPGKVWSVEHGHWHDAPITTTPVAPATPVPPAAPK